jgi:hypothetical protein
MPEYRIRAVIFKEGDWWVAQCLEYDYVAVSRSLEEMPEALQEAVTAQIVVSLEHGVEPFTGFSPAPRRFWTMYERAASALVAGHPVELPAGIRIRQPMIEARLAA